MENKGFPLGLRLFAFALALLAIVACQGNDGGQATVDDNTRAPQATAGEQPVEETAPTEGSATEGLTYEELRSTTPPAPQNLRLTIGEEGVRLEWDPAPAPSIAHGYSDIVAQYNIYRRAAAESDFVILTTTRDAYYVDKTAQEGVNYIYAVSAVHEGPVEGERTDGVSVIEPIELPELSEEMLTRPAPEADSASEEDSPPGSVPGEDPSGGGLTYEELRSTTPPAPQNLRLTSGEEGVRLEWDPAPVPGIAHGYSDIVIHYNVYRRSGGIDLILLDTTSETFFVDETAEEGVDYYYAVSAVHEGPVEGERTDEVGIR